MQIQKLWCSRGFYASLIKCRNAMFQNLCKEFRDEEKNKTTFPLRLARSLDDKTEIDCWALALQDTMKVDVLFSNCRKTE